MYRSMLLVNTPTLVFLILWASQLLVGCVWVVKLNYSSGNQQGSEWVSSNQNEFVFNGTKLFILPGTIKINGAFGPIIPIIPITPFIPFGRGFESKPFVYSLVYPLANKSRSLSIHNVSI